jgi:hypothetical protein
MLQCIIFARTVMHTTLSPAFAGTSRTGRPSLRYLLVQKHNKNPFYQPFEWRMNMSQQAKKPAAQPAAKLATNMANKAAKNTFAAVETTRNSAENVVKIGSTAVKDLLANGATEAQKAQEKVFALGRESADQLSKSADALTKSLYEAVAVSRDNVETIIELGNLTASVSKDVSSEMLSYANQAFSDNLELSKEMFAVRTINDLVELNNKAVKHAIDGFFNQTMKLSTMAFEYSNEAFEPINERVAQTTDQLSKKLSSAA